MPAIKIDGADAAVIGYADDPFRVVYSFEALVEVFGDGDRDAGLEWVSYNIERGLAYMTVGERPVIVYPADADEVDERADLEEE